VERLRLVLATVGSRGDVQPMLALALAAKARGHRPLLAAPVNFEPWARECGIEFAPFGIDFQKYLADDPRFLTGNPLAAARAVQRAMRDHTPEQTRQLRAACDGADAMLWAGVAFIAPSVAEWARIPCLGVVYSTCAIPSAQHPPPLFHWYGLPGWTNRLLWRANDWIVEHAVGGALHTARESLGLPARSLREQLLDQGHYVIAADEAVFPSDPQWDRERFARSNFIFFGDNRALDPDLDEWLRAGDAPVFAGFGSMSGPGPRRAMRAFIDAMGASGHRCLVGAGWAGVDAGSLPGAWRVVGDVPHAQLFPRVAAVVHHGGSGTTASAMRAGTPQVILPLILDQYHHAHLLHRAGLAPRPVAMERVTGESLRACVAEALRLAAAPREEAAQRLRASDATQTILERIEARAAA
jgi:vancomycin aglycone glucosyltransferase